jgi:hypothetical protein
MPDDLGARHIIVNVPSFHLEARENGRTVLEMRVVVGKPENKTPIFSDLMTTTVFSPYGTSPTASSRARPRRRRRAIRDSSGATTSKSSACRNRARRESIRRP